MAKDERQPPIKIRVSEKAKATIKAIADERGMKQEEVAGRIYGWFAAQSDEVQRLILGMYPPALEPDIAALILRQAAKGKAK